MPIFEYACTSCKKEFEELVLPSLPEPCCPSCGGQQLEKAISLPAVSSEETRERTLRGAKERIGKIRHEKEYEQHKQMHNHNH